MGRFMEPHPLYAYMTAIKVIAHFNNLLSNWLEVEVYSEPTASQLHCTSSQSCAYKVGCIQCSQQLLGFTMVQK